MDGEFDRVRLLPINVIRTGMKEEQQHIIRGDGYPAYQISVCFDGCGKFISGSGEYEVGRGDAFMFAPKAAHEYYPTSKKWSLYFFVFTGDCLEGMFRYFKFEPTEVFLSSGAENYRELCDMSTALTESGNDYRRSLCVYTLLGTLSGMKRAKPKSADGRDDFFSKLAPVADYIINKYKSVITLDELARAANVSKSYLCRTFSEAYGATPIKYLQNYRIDRAKQLLISTDMTMKKLARETGFNDTSFFCRTFKKYEGMTPEQFRRLHND